jgi:glycine/betaine/sarcosine/D-proline reductase family selenoprotein B
VAELSDLNFKFRTYMRGYRYRSLDWSPGSVLEKPLSEARLALVTTAAFYLPYQEPFDEEMKGGDYSYREISGGVDLGSLGIAHRSEAFDQSGIEADPSLALPVERLCEMVAEGELGAVNRRHFSFQGNITAPGRLVERSAPEVVERLKEDKVDAVFLTPV